MGSTSRIFRLSVLLAVFMIVTVVAVAAAVECTWQKPPYTKASNSTVVINTGVSDQLVIYPEVGYPVNGTLKWYVCGPSTLANPDCTAGTNFYTKTLSNLTVVHNGDPYTITSGIYTPTVAGNYCFRVTYGSPSNNYAAFNHQGGTANPAECFAVPSNPSAVTLSSFSESDSSASTSLYLGFAIAGALTLVGAGLVLARKNILEG